jgi:hypothetical protein
MKPGTSQDTSRTWHQMAQGLKHEAGKLQGPGQKILKLARQWALSKPWRRRRQGPTCIREQGASQQLTEKHPGARRGRTGPRPVGPGLPSWLVPGPVRAPLWPRCWSIYCLCHRRLPHQSIHQRVAGTKEKHREEADGRRKSLNCLGDSLG